MKKRFLLVCLFLILAITIVFAISQPTTEKTKVEGRSTAYIYMTYIYSSEYWSEFFISYEEEKNQFDEAVAENKLYEFISKYKVEHKFSRVEVEDVESANENDSNIKIRKRVIFRQNRK